jgi:hypothetical protein
MTQVVLDNIPFQPDMAQLREKLRIREGSRYVERFERLVSEAQAIANPKVLYKVALVDDKGDDYVVLDGVRLNSRVLRVNLEEAHRVFPYVVTCGRELYDWMNGLDDMLLGFWADAINEMALRGAIAALNEHLVERYRPGKTATMNPGSLGEWPLQQQRALFKILGDPEAAIGVELTKSCLMVPNKSVSGIQYPTETGFSSCQLCPREDCVGRKAPYDPELYDQKYRLES